MIKRQIESSPLNQWMGADALEVVHHRVLPECEPRDGGAVDDCAPLVTGNRAFWNLGVFTQIQGNFLRHDPTLHRTKHTIQ